jgi:hypothetical protein
MGFEKPEPGARHSYMRFGTFTLTLPNNSEYSVPQLKMHLREIETGIRRKISLEEWQRY